MNQSSSSEDREEGAEFRGRSVKIWQENGREIERDESMITLLLQQWRRVKMSIAMIKRERIEEEKSEAQVLSCLVEGSSK